jgi:polysaccharide biosynthesis PFTS motif protein
MKLPTVFKNLCRARMRATIRGYMFLKRNGTLGLVRNIRNDLAGRQLSVNGENVSVRIFGAVVSQAEFAVRQYLLERLLGPDFNKCLMYAIGRHSSFAYPLPPEWRTAVASHGIRVNGVLSGMMWHGYLCKHLIRGIYVLVEVLLKSLAYSFRGITPQGIYAYLYGLSGANLPRLGASGVSYDICTWYASWKGRPANISLIAHGVAATEQRTQDLIVKFMPAPYYLLKSMLEFVNLITCIFVAGIEAVISLMLGRWWNVLLFAESVRAQAVRLCSSERLPRDCLFHYSGSLYRPLWTYELEVKGERIISYFYSTYEQPKLPNKAYESQRGDWGPATWPLYLVWDKYQDEQLRRNISSRFRTIITGPIPFSNGANLVLSMPPEKSVAVFDIEAHRLSAHLPFSTLGDYFATNPDCSKRFLEDIQQVLAESGLVMAFKKKREIKSASKKSYKKLVEQLSEKSNVVIVPPEVSAMQLVGQCAAVISMPFTSTALYWRKQNIPSAYYDPSGWTQRSDRAAHGIPLLLSINELRQWILNILIGSQQ